MSHMTLFLLHFSSFYAKPAIKAETEVAVDKLPPIMSALKVGQEAFDLKDEHDHRVSDTNEENKIVNTNAQKNDFVQEKVWTKPRRIEIFPYSALPMDFIDYSHVAAQNYFPRARNHFTQTNHHQQQQQPYPTISNYGTFYPYGQLRPSYGYNYNQLPGQAGGHHHHHHGHHGLLPDSAWQYSPSHSHGQVVWPDRTLSHLNTKTMKHSHSKL